jgi:hypothetical protein
MELSPILAAVAFVVQLNAGAPFGSASGFFFQIGSERYFVTNKHVVAPPKPPKPDERPKLKPETLRLRLHTNRQNLQQNDGLDLPLYEKESGSKKWKEHPCVEADVALIPLAGVDLNRFVITWLRPDDYLPPDLVLHPGEDVFIIGYPEAFYDHLNNLPIFRNALIASAYGAPFKGSPAFLTDAKLHPGTSGSPVLTKPKNTWADVTGNTRLVAGNRYYLLGVHSGTIQWPDETREDPLGLGVAWYARLLSEIVTPPKCQ